jgi:hypothetical protein
MPPHIALLGDSILDNAGYTGGLPDVAAHLRTRVAPAEVTLLAVDGSRTTDLPRQVADVPEGVTHGVVSIGGNDGILEVDVLSMPVSTTAEAIAAVDERAASFEIRYRSAIAEVIGRIERVAVCTVYNPRLDGPENDLVRVGLMILNDVILRTAIDLGVSVVDLRFVIVDPDDFANPLEPSSSGGAKIAAAIGSAFGFETRAHPAISITRG